MSTNNGPVVKDLFHVQRESCTGDLGIGVASLSQDAHVETEVTVQIKE